MYIKAQVISNLAEKEYPPQEGLPFESFGAQGASAGVPDSPLVYSEQRLKSRISFPVA